MLKNLRNMKVKDRLVRSFVFITIMASLAGVLGAFLMLGLDARYNTALHLNGFIQGDLGEYNAYLYKDSALTRDIILLTDAADIEESKAELEKADEKVDYYLEQFEYKLENDEERALLADIKTEYPAYLELRDKAIELAAQNKDAEALKVFREEARPHLLKAIEDSEALLDMNVEMGDGVAASLSLFSKILVLIILLCVAVAIFISIKFAYSTAYDLVRPIQKVQAGTAKLAKGELDVHIDVHSKNELGEMADDLNAAIGKIREYIEVIEYGLDEVGKGNFAVRPTVEFHGDFVKIKDSIENITISLSHTLGQINEGADQVAIGSEQLAMSAQTLAEGATSQAASVQELTATIENVAAAAEDSALKANESYQTAEKYAEVAQDSSNEMKRLTEAMARITETSQQIESIIAEIEDIAEQTNLLSLNASIEAARAGEAGRGFAVVADQIGKLAADSAQSAINTKELIVKSLAEIEQGNAITTKTAEALEQVVGGIHELAGASKSNSILSTEQAETMAQVQMGIEQIADVVQNNSASAEETSATSEELSAQSQNLKALVDQFILREDCI